MRLILASQSPRRREMLSLMGYDYEIIVSDADEHVPPCAPGEFVEKLALRKADAVFASHRDCCVIGADTVVYLDGQIIGKPEDKADAFRILRMLSGRTHTVYTGVAVLTDTQRIVFHDAAEVTFSPLSDEEICAYISTGEPLDKAGAYGIQGPGSLLVERLEGCYFTVIGMPNPKLYRALRSVGVLPKWMENYVEMALLPRDKFDVSNLSALMELSDEAFIPLAKAALTWIQDMNWPVAPMMLSVLQKHEAVLADPISEVFFGNDFIWQVNIMNELFPLLSLETQKALYSIIAQIAKRIPAQDEDEAELIRLAGEALKR